jgi:hypothetical protein
LGARDLGGVRLFWPERSRRQDSGVFGIRSATEGDRGEVPSGPRRLGLRAENYASGGCLTMTASARVCRTPATNRLGSRVGRALEAKRRRRGLKRLRRSFRHCRNARLRASKFAALRRGLAIASREISARSGGGRWPHRAGDLTGPRRRRSGDTEKHSSEASCSLRHVLRSPSWQFLRFHHRPSHPAAQTSDIQGPVAMASRSQRNVDRMSQTSPAPPKLLDRLRTAIGARHW